jgi:hypothetical protein
MTLEITGSQQSLSVPASKAVKPQRRKPLNLPICGIR